MHTNACWARSHAAEASNVIALQNSATGHADFGTGPTDHVCMYGSSKNNVIYSAFRLPNTHRNTRGWCQWEGLPYICIGMHIFIYTYLNTSCTHIHIQAPHRRSKVSRSSHTRLPCFYPASIPRTCRLRGCLNLQVTVSSFQEPLLQEILQTPDGPQWVPVAVK